MEILQLLLGQVLEAIFVALFMIFVKNLKSKRLLFVAIIIVEYLLLMSVFTYNWMFHILFVVITFIVLKVLYKEKAQVTDVFIFALSYIFIIISSVICYVISSKSVIIGCIINRLLLFIPLLILNYKLTCIQNIYKKYWNRNDQVKKKMKSVTFRSLNVVIFNLLFSIINFGMVYALLSKGGV